LNIKLISRGDVWLVDFNPTRGDEINKIRPAIVVSSDSLGVLKVRIVIPLTGWKDKFTRNPWHVKIIADSANGLGKLSAADALQIRTVSDERFEKKLGRVPATTMEEIVAAIAAVIEYQ
jgi:mRNA interferase MazF